MKGLVMLVVRQVNDYFGIEHEISDYCEDELGEDFPKCEVCRFLADV